MVRAGLEMCTIGKRVLWVGRQRYHCYKPSTCTDIWLPVC